MSDEEKLKELLWSYGTGGKVYSVSVSSDGSYIAAGSFDNKVYFFNRDGRLLWSYGTGRWVSGVSVSSDGSYIAAGSSNRKVYFFNKKGELLWIYKTGNSVYGGVSISSDGSYIAAGSWDNKVYFFNRDGRLLWSYETGSEVYRVSISSDGSYIAAGSGDYKVYFFVSKSFAQIAINEAKSIISQEKTKGFKVGEAETILSQAENAFNAADYSKARILAKKAKELALDIDKDGVFIFALSLIPPIRWYIAKRRERRERIERMKAEIITMIEEAVGKDRRM